MLQDTFNGYPIYLVETLEDLQTMRRAFHPKVMVGVDTETKGLEYKPEQVVGVCLSGGTGYTPDTYAGYYIPIRHDNYDGNLPVDAVMPIVQELLDNYKTVFFNRNFDVSMLEYDGIKIPFIGGMNDAQILAYLTWNEKQQFVKLKPYTEKLLKWEVINFEDITGGDHNFGHSNPAESFRYAAGDPLCTVFLARKLYANFPYIRNIYPLDNCATEAVRRMSQQEFHINKVPILEAKVETEFKLNSIREQVYAMTGVYGFNLNSPKEKADVLSRFVTLTKKTAKGGVALDEDTLRELNHPIATLLADYSVTKQSLQFLTKFASLEPPLHGNYNLTVVASGRFSSSASKGNPYYAPMNMQNVPKIEVKMYLHHHPFLGYCLTEEKEGCVCDKDGNPLKYKTKSGLRAAFVTRGDDWVWLTADYAAQEMKLAANFSKEPTLMEPLLAGKDIHTHTAEKMFGFSSPDNRTQTKVLNFECMYGAEAGPIARTLKCAFDKAKELLARYRLVMTTLYRWKDAIIAEAKRTGLSFTYFGRPVYVHKYFSASTFSLRSYAERLTVNAKIQGCLPMRTYVQGSCPHMAQTYPMCLGHLISYGEHKGTPTHRGSERMCFVIFKSGDFCLVSSQHKFLGVDDVSLWGISDLLKGKCVQLVKPRGRKRLLGGLLYLLLHPLKTPTLGALASRMSNAVDTRAARWHAGLLKSWLLRRRIDLRPEAAHTLRSLVDFFGWNLVITKNRGFRLKWGRRRCTRAVAGTECASSSIVSPTMMSGYQTYPLMGFVHKNTGGDLIRMDCVKFEKLRDVDLGWRDNTSFQNTVHDEVNFEVHKGYLRKAWLRCLKVMNYKDDNLIIPITVDAGVGTHWGNCLDFISCSLDNRIVPKDLTPDMLIGEEREYLLGILSNCRKRDLPPQLREYTSIE